MNISLLIPCFNEELNIQKGVLDKIGNFTLDDDRFKEIIIVDDGSTDQSTTIIKELYLSKFKKFRLIEKKHKGKAFAIMTGIEKSISEFVMFTDIDLATPIEEAVKLISEAEKFPIIVGSRSSLRRGAPILRQLMAVGFIFIRNLFLDLKGVRDTQCGFKIFRRDPALKISARLHVFKNGKQIKTSSVSAGFDLEFLFLASKMGFAIKEVPVEWRHVETKNVNFIKDSLETLKDIARIKYYDLKGIYSK